MLIAILSEPDNFPPSPLQLTTVERQRGCEVSQSVLSTFYQTRSELLGLALALALALTLTTLTI